MVFGGLVLTEAIRLTGAWGWSSRFNDSATLFWVPAWVYSNRTSGLGPQTRQNRVIFDCLTGIAGGHGGYPDRSETHITRITQIGSQAERVAVPQLSHGLDTVSVRGVQPMLVQAPDLLTRYEVILSSEDHR